MLLFAGPMILGNLLQQCYNIVDTLIVGKYLGAKALAAVGSAYTLMTFLTSIIIGLCMGSGAVFSLYFGRQQPAEMKRRMAAAFYLIASVTLCINLLVILFQEEILRLLQVPSDVLPQMQAYVQIIFLGLMFTFLYNYFAFLLRALGNSVTPLWFLGAAAVMNIGLDLFFVVGLQRGIAGAAEATVLAQAFSGIGLCAYTLWREPEAAVFRFRPDRRSFQEILRFSSTSCVQQSVMNLGILMIQGLVNSFGSLVMAGFAAAVKIDSFAYMPAQEFGNAYSIFISQNHGAGKHTRVRRGTKAAFLVSVSFCLAVSLLVWAFAPELMQLFISTSSDLAAGDVIAAGSGYLRLEGAFYCGIGMLFLFYGYFRGAEQPEMSIVLTIISLGLRVVLAYWLAPKIGVTAIWAAIPIGWAAADLAGFWKLRRDWNKENSRGKREII